MTSLWRWKLPFRLEAPNGRSRGRWPQNRPNRRDPKAGSKNLLNQTNNGTIKQSFKLIKQSNNTIEQQRKNRPNNYLFDKMPGHFGDYSSVTAFCLIERIIRLKEDRLSDRSNICLNTVYLYDGSENISLYIFVRKFDQINVICLIGQIIVRNDLLLGSKIAWSKHLFGESNICLRNSLFDDSHIFRVLDRLFDQIITCEVIFACWV